MATEQDVFADAGSWDGGVPSKSLLVKVNWVCSFDVIGSVDVMLGKEVRLVSEGVGEYLWECSKIVMKK